MSEPKFSVGEEVIYVGSGKIIRSDHGAPIGSPAPVQYGDAVIILGIYTNPPFTGLNYLIHDDGHVKTWTEESRLRKKPKPDYLPADADWQEDFNRMLNPKRVYSKQTKAVSDE